VRAQLESVHLVGVDRTIELHPGLNFFYGPISSGKTSAVRLCRGVFGAAFNDLPAEVRSTVSALSAAVLFNDAPYSIVRPKVSTATAIVDVAGPAETSWRLPFSQSRPGLQETYRDWLLERLGLPRMTVPLARSNVESAPTPVTINDYMLLCHLSQADIASSVFGHLDFSRNTKRMYVTEILYGRYSVEVAQLQEDLRRIEGRIRRAKDKGETLQAALAGTAWENRAEIERNLRSAQTELGRMEAVSTSDADAVRDDPVIARLNTAVRALDTETGEMRALARHTEASIARLGDLVAQLEKQSARLTRSIVAGRLLLDYEFVVCPRCGAKLDASRGNDELCMLCLQHPAGNASREELAQEQARIESQIVETVELISGHRKTLDALTANLGENEVRRAETAQRLDFSTRSFVSDSASALQESAAGKARLEEQVMRLRDYAQLYERLDQLNSEVGVLERDRERLLARLDEESDKEGKFEQRMARLEKEFRIALEAIGLPSWLHPSSAAIDRRTYLPVIDGRSFDSLSSQGLKLLVNVAHALAHHRCAIELDLPLPGILFLDGISSHLGSEGYDRERFESLLRYLQSTHDELGDELQLIVGTNDLPHAYEPLVALRLSESDRLIPKEALTKLNEDSGQSS